MIYVLSAFHCTFCTIAQNDMVSLYLECFGETIVSIYTSEIHNCCTIIRCVAYDNLYKNCIHGIREHDDGQYSKH